MRNEGAKKLALCAMLTAIAVTINFISTMFPTMSLSIVAISGFTSAIAISECGYKRAILVFVATAILSFLILPDKQNAVLYLFLFGHYPITKFFIERIRKPVAVWAIKLLCANFFIIAVYFVIMKFFGFNGAVTGTELLFGLLISNAAFVLYDICLTRLLIMFSNKRFKR